MPLQPKLCTLPVGGAFSGAWAVNAVDPDAIDTAWQEVCKGMMPDDWAPCELGELGVRLREAALHPIVDKSKLAQRRPTVA